MSCSGWTRWSCDPWSRRGAVFGDTCVQKPVSCVMCMSKASRSSSCTEGWRLRANCRACTWWGILRSCLNPNYSDSPSMRSPLQFHSDLKGTGAMLGQGCHRCGRHYIPIRTSKALVPCLDRVALKWLKLVTYFSFSPHMPHISYSHVLQESMLVWYWSLLLVPLWRKTSSANLKLETGPCHPWRWRCGGFGGFSYIIISRKRLNRTGRADIPDERPCCPD